MIRFRRVPDKDILIKPAVGRFSTKVTSLDMSKFTLKIIFGAISTLLLIEILFDPISIADNFVEKSNTERELAAAQQLWNSTGAKIYKIKVRGFEPLVCLYDAMITVQNGEIVKVESKDPFDENSEYKIVEQDEWSKANPSYGCNYTKFTIPRVLADVSDALKSTNPLTQKPEISFDSENGYVTHYQINYHGYGLFTKVVISDCCSWYEFRNYESLVSGHHHGSEKRSTPKASPAMVSPSRIHFRRVPDKDILITQTVRRLPDCRFTIKNYD